MEYDQSNRFLKHDSDVMGAIFMCNNLTKKECFRRKLFGLASVHSDFVKQVKTGMILFLFEPDERKLNGIFQATSDGAMNIVPSAFSILKKSFPAQVRFETLCACRPLFENEFSDAIKENYFTAIKFSFALSGQQVCRLIWLFSSRSYTPFDQLPGGLQSVFMKIFENSRLARTSVTRNENLPKFDAADYTMDNNIQPTRKPFVLGRSKNHLASYKNHYHNGITLQNDMDRGQPEPYAAVSHSAKLKQHNLMLSPYCNDLSREAIPVIPSGHSSCSSFLYKQPSVPLGTDLLERKLTFRGESYLDAPKPYQINQSYISTSHIGTKDFLLSNYPGIDISKPSPFSKPSQLTLHRPEDPVNFHDFRQNAFHDSYDLSNNKLLHSSPERLQAMASTSLCVRNARSYCQPIQQKDDSWNIQDWSSRPDYIPVSEGETLVNRAYIPVHEDDLNYAKKAFELPIRKENSPLALHYDYNNTRSSDFSYNDKNSVSDLNTFPQSSTFQKRCNVFHRLSRPPKKIKYPSLDHMVEAFYHQRSQRTMVRGKLENLEESLETDVPLDNIGELGPFENDSLVDIEAQTEEFDDSNGSSLPNFKRRSVVKRQSSVASDFTGRADKCKRRKIIRPSFSEEDNSTPAEELPFSKESDTHGEARTLSANLQCDRGVPNTNSFNANIQGMQQTSDCNSEVVTIPKLAAKESEKVNSYSLMRDENVDGKPLDFIPLSVEKEQETINSSRACTSDAIASHGVPEEDAAKHTAKNSLDSDKNHIAVKMDAEDFL